MIKEQIDKEILELAKQAEKDLEVQFKNVDEVALENSNKILSAFIKNKVSYTDFADINGYGNYDTGRDKLEKIFATVLGTEDALVRPQIMSGTNALYLTFTALLKHGDTMISISGKPYDSLLEMVGIIGDSTQSLNALGVKYEQIDFIESMAEAATAVAEYIKDNNKKIAYITVMNNLSVDCDCDAHQGDPVMADLGIVASLDPIANDQAFIDMIWNAKDSDELKERIDTRLGREILPYGEELGLGSREYELINID